MTRRDFLGGAAMVGAATFARCASAGQAKGRLLRFGVLSDVHIALYATQQSYQRIHMEKALRWSEAQGVDAVVFPGDMIHSGIVSEMEIFADVWNRVFPGGKGADGRAVDKMLVTGKHEIAMWKGRINDLGQKRWDEKEGLVLRIGETWERLFGEKYEKVFMKKIKGVTFVGAQYLTCNPPIEKFLKDHADELPKDRPFFYVQHEMPNDTVNATWLVKGVRWGNGHDNGTSTKFLSKYPNVIAFSGHCHNSLTDEMSIWQGAFTAVNCSCNCGYVFMAPGRENGWSCDDFRMDPPLEMPPIDIFKVNQGLVMEVFDDSVVLERHEFRYGHRLGPDWVIPTGPNAPQPYTVEKRLKAAKKPAFPAGADHVCVC